MTNYKIALIPGDGIGPEITEPTLQILDALQERFNWRLNICKVDAGDRCLLQKGEALPQETINTIRDSHACLKGPVGETASDVVVKLRIMFDLYANIRPIKSFPCIPGVNPDIDLIFVRENTEDVYKGLEFAIGDTTLCVRVITRRACERIAKRAFDMARLRNGKKKVTAIHKANVMRVTDGLFANVCRDISKQYPDIEFNELYVDAASMRLIREPQVFDVLCTCNMFGDILSDEAAQLVGGLGMAPGANLGDNFGIFEPIHGSAPDIAGKQLANPISMILASKMMLKWLGEQNRDPECTAGGTMLENAVIKILSKRLTAPDLGGNLTTKRVGDAIASEIKSSQI